MPRESSLGVREFGQEICTFVSAEYEVSDIVEVLGPEEVRDWSVRSARDCST